MTDVPEIPEQIDSEAEFTQYVDQLHTHIESVEPELAQAGKDTQELQQQLDLPENTPIEDRREVLEEVAEALHELTESIGDIEVGKPPSDESANQLDEATGYDGR